MRRYIKRPIVGVNHRSTPVQAEAWMGTTEQYERLMATGALVKGSVSQEDGSAQLNTPEGPRTCQLNDYILQDEQGQFFCQNAATFEAEFTDEAAQ